jgi:hypothetical protein
MAASKWIDLGLSALGLLGSVASGKSQSKAAKAALKESQRRFDIVLAMLGLSKLKEYGSGMYPGMWGGANYKGAQWPIPQGQWPGAYGTSGTGAGGAASRMMGYEPQGGVDIRNLIPRQMGGPVWPHQGFLVGEEGQPEVFVPQTPGTIIPLPGQRRNPVTMPTPQGPMDSRNARIAGQQTQREQRFQPPPSGIGGYFPNIGAGNMGFTMPLNPRQPFQWPGRAGGGLVEAGQPYTVGERGPETFVPQGRQAGAAGGGTPSLGALSTYWPTYLMMNPGAMNPAAYERAQEQANVGLATDVRGITGGLTGRGIDPNTGLGRGMLSSAVNRNLGKRLDAARDYTMAQEQLFRGDIGMGMNQYLQMLQLLTNYQTGQASAAAGVPVMQSQAVSGYEPMMNYIGMLLQTQPWKKA